MDDAERAMLLDVYRGHVTAADAIARRLDIVPRDVKLRRAVAQNFDALLAAIEDGADLPMIRAAVRKSRDEYASALSRA